MSEREKKKYKGQNDDQQSNKCHLKKIHNVGEYKQIVGKLETPIREN